MQILVVTPIQEEIDFFLQSCAEMDMRSESIVLGKLPVVYFPDLNLLVAQGGLGKAQFAVQTQHLLDNCPDLQLVICAGAAGALIKELAIGDIVVATETVEHDIRNQFGPPLLPRFAGDAAMVTTFRRMQLVNPGFQVHFGPIASGDEDVIDIARGREIHQRTRALVVAWEGGGGARACQFSGIPFVEIRGVTDNADHTAAADFALNLNLSLRNVAQFITHWAKEYKATQTGG